jgi:hypothetical protein
LATIQSGTRAKGDAAGVDFATEAQLGELAGYERCSSPGAATRVTIESGLVRSNPSVEGAVQ